MALAVLLHCCTAALLHCCLLWMHCCGVLVLAVASSSHDARLVRWLGYPMALHKCMLVLTSLVQTLISLDQAPTQKWVKTMQIKMSTITV